jgi:hypothetical protein
MLQKAPQIEEVTREKARRLLEHVYHKECAIVASRPERGVYVLAVEGRLEVWGLWPACQPLEARKLAEIVPGVNPLSEPLRVVMFEARLQLAPFDNKFERELRKAGL